MENEEVIGHLDRIGAQIEALRAAVGAIARSMPNNQQVLQLYDRRAESLQGSAGAAATPDRALDALQLALSAMRAQIAPRAPRN